MNLSSEISQNMKEVSTSVSGQRMLKYLLDQAETQIKINIRTSMIHLITERDHLMCPALF